MTITRHSGLQPKLEDHDGDDFTTAELPARPCAQCGVRPWDLPHSICGVCVEEKRRRKEEA